MTRLLIGVGIGVGMLVGAAVPAAASLLLAVLPIGAAVVAAAWLWEATGWPTWTLAATALAGVYAVTVSGAVGWYGSAVGAAWTAATAGRLAAVGPIAWIEWAGLAAPLALAVGAAAALPLRVRKADLRRVAGWLRPRWSDDDDQDQDLANVQELHAS